MNREQFDKLELSEQIEYINNQLENNNSITSVCKYLKIGRSTIRDRFKKINYKYSKSLNRYIIDEKQDLTCINNECITPVITKDNDIDRDTDLIQGDVLTDIISKSDEEIRNNLLDIVKNYDVLKDIIELHRRNTSVIKQQIVIDLEDCESKLATLRVNSKELDLFNKFCEEYKQYKKMDLISQALKEFRIKHS